ncbi:Chromosome partition protein Smc [Corynebacterium diphtheriae subsp. lausannense]|nr:Chromosome partition protein Smc [Corynebacterium diphtheriae subsp. lausannense]
MSDSSFGLRIGLEGEREFKKAIADINRSMRVLGSELKLVASQFGKNESSAVALTAKNQVLAKQIDTQRNKIATLKQALENAANAFGESDSRTKNWQIQLNNAEATLNDLERELGANENAIEGFNSEAAESEHDLKNAAKGADKLEGEVDELGQELDETGGKTSHFGDLLKANLASEAIIGSVKAIGTAVKSIGRAMVQGAKDGLGYNAQMKWSRFSSV